jgi:hypothetical protein
MTYWHSTLVDMASTMTAAWYLAGRVRELGRFVVQARKTLPLAGLRRQEHAPSLALDELRDRLGRKRPAKSLTVTVRGTFFPAVLLTQFWWERESPQLRNVAWHDGVQEWLFNGFEQWGPSWDVSSSVEDVAHPHLFGQLASGDEGNSVPVIIEGTKADGIRARFREFFDSFQGRQPQTLHDARVTGVLCHRSDLEGDLANLPSLDADAFEHCLIVTQDDPDHEVLLTHDPTPLYSAYLWQCLAPTDWLKPGHPLTLHDLYFAWEHTDISKPDAVKYNLDSLRRKEAYLRRKLGALTLVQKSCPLVPGDPALPVRAFYEALAQK